MANAGTDTGDRLFLSTPSARRATITSGKCPDCAEISIHALREEGDRTPCPRTYKVYHFYPRPPRGGRPDAVPCRYASTYFYPRPPRGGRPITSGKCPDCAEISIHALREEGDRKQTGRDMRTPISIHALREEGDADAKARLIAAIKFLSTPSARRATRPGSFPRPARSDFYPRPPRGGRPSPAP